MERALQEDSRTKGPAQDRYGWIWGPKAWMVEETGQGYQGPGETRCAGWGGVGSDVENDRKPLRILGWRARYPVMVSKALTHPYVEIRVRRQVAEPWDHGGRCCSFQVMPSSDGI
jgi:hypothetical protein